MKANTLVHEKIENEVGNSGESKGKAVKWLVCYSKVLGETVVLVTHKRYLKAARAALPRWWPVYLPPEVDELMKLKEQMDAEVFGRSLRDIHLAKHGLEGWVIPGTGESLVGKKAVKAVPAGAQDSLFEVV